MAKVLMASPIVDDVTTATPPSESLPSNYMLHYLQKVVPHLPVCITMAKQKNFVVTVPRLHKLKDNPHDISHELTSLSVIPIDDFSPFHQKSVSLDVAETSAFKKYALESRHAVGAREDQDILVGCCLVLPEGRRLIHAFPEVLCVDGTHETKHESRPLLTLSVKDLNGKITVVVMCIAPSERSWFFHWLFEEAHPVLLGAQSLHCVKLIMTESDSQEMSQVDFTISTYFVNAVCTQCGWHLVDQGWREN